jgi:ketosteroid isomerase-like protein
MKRIPTFAVVAGLIASCGFPDRAVWAKGGAGRGTYKTVVSVKDTLIQIEHVWGNAMVKGDVAGFNRCVADEWVLTTSDGRRITKTTAQADFKEGVLKIESFRLREVTVRVYGNTAVVLGLITENSKFRGQDTSGKRRFTDVFVKRDSRWQAVVSHQSRANGSSIIIRHVWNMGVDLQAFDDLICVGDRLSGCQQIWILRHAWISLNPE